MIALVEPADLAASAKNAWRSAAKAVAFAAIFSVGIGLLCTLKGHAIIGLDLGHARGVALVIAKGERYLPIRGLRRG